MAGSDGAPRAAALVGNGPQQDRADGDHPPALGDDEAKD